MPATPRPIDQNPAAVYLAGLANGSRRTMRAALDTIADMLIPPTAGNPVPPTDGDFVSGADALSLNWSALRFQHTTAIRSRLAKKYSRATANKMLSALRGVLKAAWRLGQMTAEDYTRAADIKSISGSTLPRGRALTSGEITALLEACAADPSPAGARDAALIAVLRAGGLRRAEVCNLDLSDYKAAAAILVIHGRRNMDREIPIHTGTLDALNDWLAIRGLEAGPIFMPINKGGKLIVRRMYPEAVFNALAKRAAAAGVKGLSPHDLRRTFVSDLLDAGADISTVQRLAGHANASTTVRYGRRGEAAERKAIDLLQVPYHRRATTG
jgi:integrase